MNVWFSFGAVLISESVRLSFRFLLFLSGLFSLKEQDYTRFAVCVFSAVMFDMIISIMAFLHTLQFMGIEISESLSVNPSIVVANFLGLMTFSAGSIIADSSNASNTALENAINSDNTENSDNTDSLNLIC